jgi:hypothetical protein
VDAGQMSPAVSLCEGVGDSHFACRGRVMRFELDDPHDLLVGYQSDGPETTHGPGRSYVRTSGCGYSSHREPSTLDNRPIEQGPVDPMSGARLLASRAGDAQ